MTSALRSILSSVRGAGRSDAVSAGTLNSTVSSGGKRLDASVATGEESSASLSGSGAGPTAAGAAAAAGGAPMPSSSGDSETLVSRVALPGATVSAAMPISALILSQTSGGGSTAS